MAFIVVAHRQLGFDRLLGPLLGAVTAMPVSAIAQGQRIEPNTVVLLPAHHDLALADERFVLSAQEETRRWPNTITKFLRSLAMDAGARSVAVILSGLANDGSAALRPIKAAGGTTFAQSNPKWSDMPRHAVETGDVDFLLSSEDIGRALALMSDETTYRAGALQRDAPSERRPRSGPAPTLHVRQPVACAGRN
jgi:chemotaxis response regulator CheB